MEKIIKLACLILLPFGALDQLAAGGSEPQFRHLLPNNIGRVILDIEAGIPGRPNVGNQLDDLVGLAVDEIQRSSSTGQNLDEKQKAVHIFSAIARALKNANYRHQPGTYPKSLTSVLSSSDKLFDCDTGSFIFLAVADALRLPVSMVEVEVPDYSPAREFGDHNFVRWNLSDGDSVDWDPNSESLRIGDKKTEIYGYSWSRTQLKGYAFFVRGRAWEEYAQVEKQDRRRYFENSLADYDQSVRLFSQYLKNKNNIAWLLSTRRELHYLDREKEALQLANEVISLNDTANSKDTLACAYALNQDFPAALQVQMQVIAQYPKVESFSTNFKNIKDGKNCIVDD